MIAEKKCDFAIGPEIGDPAIYAYRLITKDYFLLAVPKRYDVSAYSEKREGLIFPWLDVSRLTTVDFVFQESSCNVRKVIDQVLEQNQLKVKQNMEFANSILAIQAAERQLGCCFLSESFLPYITHRDCLRYYCVGDSGSMTASGVIYEKDKIFNRQETFCIAAIKKSLIAGKQQILAEFSRV